MNSLTLQLVLLAEKGRFSDMGRQFRTASESSNYLHLLILFAVLVGLGLAIWLAMQILQRKNRKHYHSPRALFGELCQTHDLSRAEQQLLRRLASTHALEQPARLFLEPQRFDPISAGDLSADDRQQIVSLRSKLFA